jgi:hypothetical protein
MASLLSKSSHIQGQQMQQRYEDRERYTFWSAINLKAVIFCTKSNMRKKMEKKNVTFFAQALEQSEANFPPHQLVASNSNYCE